MGIKLSKQQQRQDQGLRSPDDARREIEHIRSRTSTLHEENAQLQREIMELSAKSPMSQANATMKQQQE